MANKYNRFELNGQEYAINYDRPKSRRSRAEPVRARINILGASGKKALSKGDVYGDHRKTKLDYVVYGKSVPDIYNHKVPAAAAKLYAQLIDVGYIRQNTSSNFGDESGDLAAFLESHKEEFFEINYLDVRPETRKAYKAQYDRMIPDCRGFVIDAMTDSDYKDLINHICTSAAQQSRGEKKDWQVGEEASASGKKRLTILFTALRYFISCGYSIPEPPEGYVGRPSREEEIMDLVDNARSFPISASNAMARAFDVTLPALFLLIFLQMDTEVRLSEVLALTWGNIIEIATTQGSLYALQITGQLSPTGVRTETLKTAAAYRTIPISVPLGTAFSEQKIKLSKRFGNIDNTMILAVPSADGTTLISSPEVMKKQRREYLELCRTFFDQVGLLDALKDKRAYVFDIDRQDRHLESMLTDHALRRNRITALYTRSGITMEEICHESGHAKKNDRPTGASVDEIKLSCLKKFAAGTQIFPQGRLKCPVSGVAEIPACHFVIEVPPRAEIMLRAFATEPDTVVRFVTPAEDSVEKVKVEELPAALTPQREELLADSKFFDIKCVKRWVSSK